MITRRLLPAVLVAAGSCLFAAPASAQATRTWVSGVGDDVNPCSRTAPCKTFAGAISKTAAGGEINAIDPGGFGAVTITKALTIDVRGVNAGVLNAGTHGVVVNAGPTDSVVLRGLDVFGSGCSSPTGVRVLQAGDVRVEDTTIARQGKAVEVAPGAGRINVLLNRVEISESCTHGVAVSGGADVAIRNSTISSSGTALSVADGGTAWLTGSLLFANALGLAATGTGAINDFGDNRYVANTVDGTPTRDLTPVPPTGPAGPTGATGATGAPGPAGPAGTRGEPAIKLLVATASGRLAARSGRAVTLRYDSSLAAERVLTVSRKGKTVATSKGATRAGANAIRLATKRLAAGTYTVTLTVTAADGQSATTKATLRLR